MKSTIIIIISFPVLLLSQNVKNNSLPFSLYTNEQKDFIYDTILEVSETTKNIIYQRAKDWVNSNTRTTDNNVLFDDKDFNEIKTDITVPVGGKYVAAFVNAKLILKFKENKCKITFQSFLFQKIGKGTLYEESFNKIDIAGVKAYYKEFDERFPNILNSLLNSLQKNEDKEW
jgi:hypothetical protein